jgi:hypothetical protein
LRHLDDAHQETLKCIGITLCQCISTDMRITALSQAEQTSSRCNLISSTWLPTVNEVASSWGIGHDLRLFSKRKSRPIPFYIRVYSLIVERASSYLKSSPILSLQYSHKHNSRVHCNNRVPEQHASQTHETRLAPAYCLSCFRLSPPYLWPSARSPIRQHYHTTQISLPTSMRTSFLVEATSPILQT